MALTLALCLSAVTVILILIDVVLVIALNRKNTRLVNGANLYRNTLGDDSDSEGSQIDGVYPMEDEQITNDNLDFNSDGGKN